MIYLKVFYDGTVLPDIANGRYIICVHNGVVRLGVYNRDISLHGKQFYMQEVGVPDLVEREIHSCLTESFPEVYVKKHPVYLLCPGSIVRML